MATFPEPALGWFNAGVSWLVDLVSSPLLALPPVAGLLLIAIATAAVMVRVIARTSDQDRLKRTKRGIHAALFEIRLFNDDLRAVARALGDALRHNAAYLRLSLVPLAWMAIPLTLLLVHLHAVYGYTGLAIGVPALVKVELRSTVTTLDAMTDAALDAPAGVRVDAGPVHLPAVNQVLWRIVPVAAGEYVLTLRVGDTAVTKALVVSHRPARRSLRRVSAGVVDQLLHPSEPPLPVDGRIAAISVSYPDASIELFGWSLHWLVPYVGFSIAAALILARRGGVTL